MALMFQKRVLLEGEANKNILKCTLHIDFYTVNVTYKGADV